MKNELAFLDSFSGALISTGAAGNADIGVDDVLAVAFGNSLNGALLGTGAAGNTSIGDDVSHGITSKIILYVLYVRKRIFIVAWIFENAIAFS